MKLEEGHHEHGEDGDNGDEFVPFQFVFCDKRGLEYNGNVAMKSDTMEGGGYETGGVLSRGVRGLQYRKSVGKKVNVMVVAATLIGMLFDIGDV